jgi:hypothetical protein
MLMVATLSPRRRPWVLFAMAALPLLLWWLAYFPGLVSPDSAGYTIQAVQGRISADYSVTYTAFLWVSLQLTGGIAPLILLQLLAMAAALTYAGTGVRLLGARWRWVAVVVIGLALTPMVGAFASYLSKDVAFVIAQVFALGSLARIVAARTVTTRSALVLGAAFLFMCLFRNNGAPMVLLAAALAAIGLRRQGVRVLLAAAAAIAVWAALSFAVFPAAGVHRAHTSLVLGTTYADVAFAYQRFPETFTEKNLALMSSVSPLTHWKQSTNCYTSDQLDVSRKWNLAASEQRSSQLFHLWLQVVRRTPQAVIDARVCRGAIAWMVFPPKAKTTSLVPTPFPPRDYFGRAAALTAEGRAALRARPLARPFTHAAAFLEKLTFSRNAEFALWRGATWAWISYAVAVFTVRRRRWRVGSAVALVSVIVANQVGVLVDNPNQLARYMYGCALMGVLLLPLLSIRADRRRPQASDSVSGHRQRSPLGDGLEPPLHSTDHPS